jgi:hypothetical protein
LKRDEKQTQLDEGVVVFESKSIRSYCATVMEGVAALYTRIEIRNPFAQFAARSEHLRNVRRRSQPVKGQRSWSLAEQEKVKLLFPNKRSLEKALPHRTWIAIRSRAGLLGLRKKQHRWLASDLSKLRRMWSQERRSTNYVT